MSVFNEGESIQKIIFPDDSRIEVQHTKDAFCDKIMVVHEKGQFSEVPWFACYRKGMMISKWNSAHIQGVSYSG